MVFGIVMVLALVHAQVKNTLVETIAAFSDTESCFGIYSDGSGQ